ncbi:MAG: hypothetical protein ACYTEQ_11390 [Planctomycetota bacterium]
MAKVTVDWDDIWLKFSDWYDQSDDVSWEDQQIRIQFLVDEQLQMKQLN